LEGIGRELDGFERRLKKLGKKIDYGTRVIREKRERDQAAGGK
jgi:hypothetical protein